MIGKNAHQRQTGHSGGAARGGERRSGGKRRGVIAAYSLAGLGCRMHVWVWAVSALIEASGCESGVHAPGRAEQQQWWCARPRTAWPHDGRAACLPQRAARGPPNRSRCPMCNESPRAVQDQGAGNSHKQSGKRDGRPKDRGPWPTSVDATRMGSNSQFFVRGAAAPPHAESSSPLLGLPAAHTNTCRATTGGR